MTKESQKKVKKNFLLTNRLNYFTGWQCNIGLENLNIKFTGEISSACGEYLYGYTRNFNLYDPNFIKNFSPVYQPVICSKFCCNCEYEINTSKKLIQ